MMKFLSLDLIESLSHSAGYIKTQDTHLDDWGKFLSWVKQRKTVRVFFIRGMIDICNYVASYAIYRRDLAVYLNKSTFKRVAQYVDSSHFYFEIVSMGKVYVVKSTTNAFGVDIIRCSLDKEDILIDFMVSDE